MPTIDRTRIAKSQDDESDDEYLRRLDELERLFFDTLPPLEPNASFEEQWEKLERHYERVFGERPGGDASMAIIYRAIEQQFQQAGRTYPAPFQIDPYLGLEADDPNVEEIDRVAPGWRKGQITKEQMRELKKLFKYHELIEDSAIYERLGEILERENPQWRIERERSYKKWLDQQKDPDEKWRDKFIDPSYRDTLNVRPDAAAAIGGWVTAEYEDEQSRSPSDALRMPRRRRVLG